MKRNKRKNQIPTLAIAATLSVLGGHAQAQFGGFGPYTVLDTDFISPEGVFTVDLDHDGLEDVVTWGAGAIAHSGRAFLTRINNGSDPVSFTETFYTVNATNGLIAGDFNNDGWTDLVPFRGSNPVPRFQVFFGDGTGALSAGPDQDVIVANSNNAKSVFASDIDLDGDTDILVLDSSFPTTVIALYNDGTGIFGSQEVLISGQWSPESVAAIDVDNDGINEILIATSLNSQSHVRVYDRPDTASAYQAVSVRSTVNSPMNIASGDIDLDGDIDLAVGGRGSGFDVSVLTNDGTGTFSRTDYDARFVSQVELIDFDGDGNLDLVNSNESDRRFRIRLNDGSGVFGDAIDVSTGGTSGRTAFLSFPDLDGNGSPDVAFPNGTNNGGSDTSFRFALNLTPIFAPGPFALSIPADNAADLALPEHITGWQINQPKFTWAVPTGFSVTYDLSISTTGGNPVEVYSAAGLAGPSHPVPSGVLVAGTEYQWQVTANNPIGSSAAPPFLMTMAPGPRTCPPDLNGDGLLDFFDILDFLEAFSAGCP